MLAAATHLLAESCYWGVGGFMAAEQSSVVVCTAQTRGSRKRKALEITWQMTGYLQECVLLEEKSVAIQSNLMERDVTGAEIRGNRAGKRAAWKYIK